MDRGEYSAHRSRYSEERSQKQQRESRRSYMHEKRPSNDDDDGRRRRVDREKRHYRHNKGDSYGRDRWTPS